MKIIRPARFILSIAFVYMMLIPAYGAEACGSDSLKASIRTSDGRTFNGELIYGANTIIFRHLPERGRKDELVLLQVSATATDTIDIISLKDSRNTVKINHNRYGGRYNLQFPDLVKGDDPYRLQDDGWRLSWSEEFETTELDFLVWSYCKRGYSHWCNKMIEDPAFAYQEKGNAVLLAAQNKDFNKDTLDFLTGGLTTKGKHSFRDGRLDIRVKMDEAKGFWPAVWMLPDARVAWPAGGEIDIMEHLNYDDIIYQTVHSTYTKSVNAKIHKSQNKGNADITGRYCLLSVELFQDCISFYIDGIKQFTYEKESEHQFPFSKYAYNLILSAQLGGPWPGNPDGTDLPAAMYVDFVRFYEKL